MSWVLLVGLVGLLIFYLATLYIRRDMRTLVRTLRGLFGWGSLAAAGILLLLRQVGIATILAFLGITVLTRGRIGPIDLTTTGRTEGSRSKVRSKFLEMELDHDSGDVFGRVVAGGYRGKDLIDLDENEMREFLTEVSRDSDSHSLLVTWLDANRSGWRDHFGFGEEGPEEPAAGSSSAQPMDRHQALQILGLNESASDAEIKAAHRHLLKKMHPDQGGSNFLASRINAAKDYLLKNRTA